MSLTERDLSTFGTLLKAFRTRRHLTQQRLAEALGMHRHAIGRWEQGDFLPASKAMVLELAKCLRLDDQETRQLLEASLSALAPYFLVPFPRNRFFTGREEILEALHTQLGGGQAIALTQSSALHGLGGIGKTQVALEYAYRHVQEYSAVFWIGAETEESMVASLLRIAETLRLPERDEKDQQQVVIAVQHWLISHSQWLLIWDNVEDLELLNRFLPSTHSGAILITTRSQALGTLAQGMGLSPMEREEGMLFLLCRAKILPPEATQEHLQHLAVSLPGAYACAEELVELMGGLPLALDQAGAYIEETGCSLVDYIQRYKQRRGYLLNRRGSLASDHPQSVSTTFQLAMERVQRAQPTAATLLRICAFLHADAIPEELFVEGAAHLGPELASLATDPSQFDQAIAVLRGLSLVQRHPERGTLSLHRLVQVVLRDEMREQERAIWQQRVISALNALFPEVILENTTTVWRQCERLLPHVLAGAAAIPDQAGGSQLAQVLWKTADYLCQRAQYGQIEPLYQRALHVGKQALGAGHPTLASPLTGLAHLYLEQGKLEQAEPLFQRALEIREQALGPEHPLVTHPLMGLATLYEKQGKSEQAKVLYERVLDVRKQVLGPEHPLVAQALNNLAILYKNQGKLEQAEPLYERALSIWEQALGPEHPQLARLLHNLAILYKQQGKYGQAEPLFQRALRIAKKSWGLEHPNLAYPLDGLADLYVEQGKDEQAEPLLKRALRLWERALGSEHLLVTYPLRNLAILSQRQGRSKQAEQLARRALRLAEQALGPEHPQVAHSLDGLADLYARRGMFEQAESLYQRALQIREQTLGAEHPDLAASLNGLANLYLRQGEEDQAEPLYERALYIREQHLGRQHPATAQTMHDLAIFRQKQGNLSEALSFTKRSLTIRSQSLGETHPKTVATRALYTQMVQEQPDAKIEVPAELVAKHHAGAHKDRNQASSPDENDPLQAFLDAYCELHPHAWSRSSDLWEAYQCWVEQCQERHPLARGAFITQLKRHGCCADRTMSVRIWRGIALVKKEP